MKYTKAFWLCAKLHYAHFTNNDAMYYEAFETLRLSGWFE